MSEASGSRKTLAGWTMVDSKGEVMTDDSRSVSSESSTESLSLFQDDSIGDTITTAASTELPLEEVNGELEDNDNFPSVPSFTDAERVDKIPHLSDSDVGDFSNMPPSKSPEPLCESADVSQCMADSSLKSVTETVLDDCQSTSDTVNGLAEKDVGLGACCEGLMESASDAKNEPSAEECKKVEDNEENHNIPLDADDSISSPNFLDDDNGELRQRHNSDSDSDFVQINEENLDEFEEELIHSRDDIQNRSPSIAEGFNFLGPAGIRNERPDNGHVSDRDVDFEEDFNEDTESSTEDIGDDRIESDQSEVGSVMNNILTDVGDLSAFADIGDLPIVAGNVARNYCHRPNKGLSTVLNVILVVVSILTMGISIGLIMATDLEIMEWQQAYNIQAKKASSLEWTLADLNKLMQDSKDKVNAYESVLKSFSKAEIHNGGSSKFFSSFSDIVTNFETCTRKHGSLSSVDCHALVLPDIRLSLSQFKDAIKTGDEGSFDFTFDGISRRLSDIAAGLTSKDEQIHSTDDHQKLQEMQLSLQREQERALHWQNLYLLERRQREWERENEDLEDQRERAQWEKEDEEEDRIMREKWEKEEAENDRKERLLWEQEDQEQDKLEREKWNKERAELDDLECLKKLMNTNLTFFRQHVMNWNISAFDDFVNMSMLMSSIAEMKQSVLSSVQQIWVEAEETLKKMGDDVKNGKRSYLDTSVMADYLKQALSILRSQFDDVVNVHSRNFNEKEKPDASKAFSSTKENNQKGPKVNHGNAAGQDAKTKKAKESGIWNKTVGKLFKKTSKSLRKFVRTISSSWTEMLSDWKRKAPHFMKTTEERASKDSKETLLFPPWLQGKSCRHLSKEQNVVVDIGSACLWDVRDSLMNHVLQEPCDPHNRYSLACNVDASTVWRLKRDLMKILDVDANFRSNRMTRIDGHNILGSFSEFWKQWEKSELLLEYDKDWASCLLKEWSDAVYSAVGWTKATGRNCHRFVDLKTVFMDIESRIIYPSDQSKKPEGDDVIEDKDGDEVTVEDSFDDSVENTLEIDSKYSSSQFDDGADVDDEDGDIHMYDNFNNAQSEEYYDYDYDEDNESDNSAPLEKKSSDKKAFQTKNNFTDDEVNRSDNHKQTAWYLKRAQHRLEMRRAQEKADWLFDISYHRDEMRKEHNTEIKSGQWVFDQAEEREAQRRKDHEADWMFDRAHHRREEFAKKWSRKHQPAKHGKWDNENDCHHLDHECLVIREKRKKMKDLSKSDWLLQSNGRRGHKVKGKWKNAFKNAHKTIKKYKKKNKGKPVKQHHHHKGKQHKNKKHFQKKSPKK